jgi:hypothetical protein
MGRQSRRKKAANSARAGGGECGGSTGAGIPAGAATPSDDPGARAPWWTRTWAWVSGAAVVAVGGFGLWANAAQVALLPSGPELQVQTAQMEEPFVALFSVRNQSSLFAQRHVLFTCELIEVRGPNTFKDVVLRIRPSAAVTIGAGDSANFTCPVKMVFSRLGDGPFDLARIKVTVGYDTVGFAREPVEELFTWNRHSKQWAKGRVIF